MVTTLNNGGFTASAAAPICEDLCVQASSLVKVVYSHCPIPEANCVAHTLVNDCKLKSSIWVDDPPSSIISMLIDDASTI